MIIKKLGEEDFQRLQQYSIANRTMLVKKNKKGKVNVDLVRTVIPFNCETGYIGGGVGYARYENKPLLELANRAFRYCLNSYDVIEVVEEIQYQEKIYRLKRDYCQHKRELGDMTLSEFLKQKLPNECEYEIFKIRLSDFKISFKKLDSVIETIKEEEIEQIPSFLLDYKIDSDKLEQECFEILKERLYSNETIIQAFQEKYIMKITEGE